MTVCEKYVVYKFNKDFLAIFLICQKCVVILQKKSF
jgi:hypothetical protein